MNDELMKKDKKEEKVSIIMGVFNANRNNMINESIQSIINQTYQDWELIICDDGSTDGTYEILLNWSKKEKRINIIKNKKNMGLAYSLNHCLNYVTGEYIARMDIDDISAPRRFEYQIAFLKQHSELMFCSTAAKLFDEKGYWAIRYKKEFPEKKDFLFTSPFIHAALFARRSFFEELRYDITRTARRAEDYDLFMRAYTMGFFGGNISEALYDIRENKECYSRRKYRERFYEIIIRARGFYHLGLLPKGIPFVFKPLIVGLIPQKILRKVRKEDYKIYE